MIRLDVDYETKNISFCKMNEINLSLFGVRLKEERKDLGLSQSDAADLVGVTREHWGRCERGLGMPGGEVLAALANAGADVLYILTGTPAATHAALGHVRTASEIAGQLGGTKQEQAKRAEAAFQQLHQPLSTDEQALLDTYRRCTPQARSHLIQTAALLSAGISAPAAPAPPRSTFSIGRVHGDSHITSGDVTNHGPISFGVSPPPDPGKKPRKS